MGHILGPKSDVSIARLVELLLPMAMEIWDGEEGPFGPLSAVFAILGHVRNTILPLGKIPIQKRKDRSCSI